MPFHRKTIKHLSLLIITSLLIPFCFVLVAYAQSPTSGTVLKDANLRAGPGTTYAIVGSAKAGQSVTIVGTSNAADWYHLVGDKWIAAFLVKVTTSTPSSAPTATVVPVAPTETSQTNGSPKVIISFVLYDGEVYRVESDEYAVISNAGTAPANMGGWLLNAGDPGQNFMFPAFTLAPGQSVRVYTDEIHSETGGFSFGIHRAIWNNQGDCGYLYDTSGNEVSEYCY